VTTRATAGLWIAAVVAAAAAYGVVAKRRARDVDAADVPSGRPRIVSLVSGVVDTLSVLDSLDCLVAVGSNRTMDFPGTEGKPRILADERGGMTNAEGVLALRPDYVFVARELAPSLEGRGLNVIRVPQDSMAEMREFVMSLGRIVGKEERARAALEHMDAKMAEIRKRVAGRPRVRVYWEDTAVGRTRGPGTAVHEMIELAGGENIYQDARIARPTIGVETILGADPEVIVLNTTASASPADVKARPGWDRMTAVRTGRVFVIPFEERSVTLFSPRCADCCERTFLRWFHPELFAEEAPR
jgi:iron complex transport system substrate-binding protein